MKNRRIRARTYILALLVVLLPVLFNFYSPVFMVWGIHNGIITFSFLIFGTWFILSLFMGRSASCGYTCPYGALQEVLNKAQNKKPKSKKANNIRYVIFVLFLLMVSYFILNVGGLKGVNLFTSDCSLLLVTLIPAFIIAISFLSIIMGSRAFCRYLCPQGVFLTIGTELGRKIKIPCLHLRTNHKDCSNCKLCDKSCPMGLDVSDMVKKGNMENLNCILCGECIEKCPKKAINYSFSIND